jgi:ferredoxin
VDSPYEILLIDRDADDAEIQQAYRRRVMETHPDLGGSVDDFQRVKTAYEELTSDSTDDGSAAGAEAEETLTDYRIEYLNYEVLDDHGWALGDRDLFEKAGAAALDPQDYGRFLARSNETLLEAAERSGFTWPYSCRGGACANCAVAIVEGDLSMPVSHVLPQELLDRGVRLSCVGTPVTDDLKVVYNVKHLPDVEELLLPPGPFEWANAHD